MRGDRKAQFNQISRKGLVEYLTNNL